MKQYSCITQRRVLRTALFAAILAILAFNGTALAAAAQSNERKNMRRVGHVDLQGRPSYQPNVIQYPNGKWYAFAGTHNNIPVPIPKFTFLPNPLNKFADEPNGTMIIDVTNPAKPEEVFHIPVPVGGGQAQMVRLCLGSDLPAGQTGKVYLARNIQGNTAQLSGYEIWDVTNPKAPFLASALRGIRSTHKLWWECNTGVAYLPGSKDASFGLPLWRQSQSMVIVDWSDPTKTPTILRTFGLVGAQPSGTGPVPPSLHGAISAHEHPNAFSPLARAATTDDIIGNRIYGAWGVGDDGVLTIIDRKKLLPPLSGGRGGTFTGNPDNPTNDELTAPLAGILYMSPDQGGHTSMPVFGLEPRSYQAFTEFTKRDIVLLASEATADLCDEAPHWSFVVDVTVENSKTAPPGTRVEQNVFQGPMVLSTLSVDPFSGEKFERGNYCTRGARFGVHSSEENFNNPLYGKLTATAYFTGGVRIWDIREPQAPVEVAFYVPEANANTRVPDGYMTNNVEIDDRGFIYVVDRNGAGMDILQLTGKAADIVFPAGP